MVTEAAKEPISPLFEVIKFEPEPLQEPILRSEKRFILVPGGEHGGKSIVATKKLIKEFLKDRDKNPNDGDGFGDPLLYWLIGASYGETTREFNYLIDDFITLFGGPQVKKSKRVDPGYIEVKFKKEPKPRIRIDTKSATDPTKMSQVAPHGIIMCEAGQMDVEIFERAQGRVTPKNGWLFMVGTFEESLGWYPQLSEQWRSGADDRQSFSLPSWANSYMYPGGQNDPKILELKRNSSDRFFMERIEGKPVPPRGVVFPEFRADIHIVDTPYVKGEPVHLWIDPGYAGAFAIEAFQMIDGCPRGIDEVYETGLVTEQMISIVRGKPWANDIQYGVGDIAARAHQAMPAVAEIFMKPLARGGLGLILNSHKVLINEGTERLAWYLGLQEGSRQPRITFSPKQKGILSEFGAAVSPIDGQSHIYSWKTDREGNIVGSTPDDKWNHGIKATIYGLIDNFGYGGAHGGSTFTTKRHHRRGLALANR